MVRQPANVFVEQKRKKETTRNAQLLRYKPVVGISFQEPSHEGTECMQRSHGLTFVSEGLFYCQSEREPRGICKIFRLFVAAEFELPQCGGKNSCAPRTQTSG